MMIKLSDIRIDGNTQAREKIDTETVKEYAEIDTLPPVVVFFDGVSYWLADGFHRYHAALSGGDTEIDADVRNGDVRIARWFAIGTNTSHGLRRSINDKRKAVVMALEDMEWSKLSDRKLGAHAGVSHTFVSDTRKALTTGNVASRSGSVSSATTKKMPGRGAKTDGNWKSRTPPPDDDDSPGSPVFNTATMQLEHPVASKATPSAPVEIEVRDERGNVVTDPDLRQVFTQAHEIAKLAAMVSGLKTHIGTFKKNPLAAEIRFPKIEADLTNVMHAIKAAIPYCQCPYMPNCERGACTACKGKKWITEMQWNQVPEEIRGAAA